MLEINSPNKSAPADVDRPPLLNVAELRVHYPLTQGVLLPHRIGSVRAVDGVSFRIYRDETLGLVGESGCGKSTTGRALVRLVRPTDGSILFDGRELVGLERQELRQFRRRIQMIFQDPYSSLNPVMPVHWLISEPMMINGVGTPKQREERVKELLDLVGLSQTAIDRYPHEFSGGQRQRIGIARALALDPELLIADEPVSALDVSIRAQIINLLERLQDQLHLTYLFIAHDLSLVYHISDRLAVMYLGRIVETGVTTDVYQAPFHPYTLALLSARPPSESPGVGVASAHHPARRCAQSHFTAGRVSFSHPLLAARSAWWSK